MELFVDYNNLPRADLGRGLVYVVDRILSVLGYLHLHTHTRVHFRLYDGWYSNRTPTRRAQAISTELLANFPLTRTFSDGTNTTTLIVNAELAYSLKIDPSHHLWHTFRQRSFPRDLGCHHPTSVGCTAPTCVLSPMHTLIATGRCPSAGCGLIPDQMLHRNEQKLVDTMLAADLLFLHLQRQSIAVIVSSDDDMWPAIKTVLDLGMTIIHVHTHPGRRTPAIYSRGPRPSYTEINL